MGWVKSRKNVLFLVFAFSETDPWHFELYDMKIGCRVYRITFIHYLRVADHSSERCWVASWASCLWRASVETKYPSIFAAPFSVSCITLVLYNLSLVKFLTKKYSCWSEIVLYLFTLIMPSPVGKGAVSFAFVRPSVRLSVTYTANNSRTQRPIVPKFIMNVVHLWCDSHASFKVKSSKVKVTRPINADTSCGISSDANLPHTAGCCCSAYFSAISVSICTKLACSIPMRNRNIATVTNFRISFSKSRFISVEKQIFDSFCRL